MTKIAYDEVWVREPRLARPIVRPGPNVRPDWEHPLSKKLLAFIFPLNTALAVDVVNGCKAQGVTSGYSEVGDSYSPEGVYLDNQSGTILWWEAPASSLADAVLGVGAGKTTPVSVVAHLKPLSSWGYPLQLSRSGGYGYLAFRVRNDNKLSWVIPGQDEYGPSSVAAPSGWCCVGGSIFPGRSRQLYAINGVSAGSASAVLASYDNNGQRFGTTNATWNQAYDSKFWLASVALFRGLEMEELCDATRDPYSLLIPR